MTIDQLIVLLPCHSLDDLPTNLSSDEAEGVLAAWSALWHPRLIAAAGTMVSWRRAEFFSDAMTGKLIVVPLVVERQFGGDLETRANSEGAALVRGVWRRDEIVSACLANVSDQAPAQTIDPELVADFLAFGALHLMSELLVRRMRYTSTLDDGRLQSHALAAAQAAVAGKGDEARQALGQCAAVLLESRGRYYPVDTSLLDLTLLAPTTLGAGLKRELAGSQPLSVLASGEVVALLAEQHPETLAALRGAVAEGRVALVGGEWSEVESPLAPLEVILRQLSRGLAAYQQHLSARPTVYGRRRYGLTGALPRMLLNLGFRAALHFTLDDGRFPQSDATKTRWEGFDSATIDAIGRAPLDARASATYLSLAEKIGHAMDHDHVATVGFAHWPAQTSLFHDDLRRVNAYAPVLGKFLSAEQYFTDTDPAGGYSRFAADEYRSPYLQQAVTAGETNPISRWPAYFEQYSAVSATAKLQTLTALLSRKTSGRDPAPDTSLDAILDPRRINADDATALAQLGAAQQALAAAIPRQPKEPVVGYLALNPASYGRRVLVDVSDLSELPPIAAPVKAGEDLGGRKRVVVDLPPMGFAWIAPTGAPPGSNWSGEPIAAGQTLRNEFCEVTVDPRSGGIQSVRDFRNRAPRGSQRLIVRPADAPADTAADDAEAGYSRMQADSVEVTDPGLLRGEITSRGQLVDPTGKRLAGFVQRVQMTLGSRLVVVEVELTPETTLGKDPWTSYIASRFAWQDRSAELRRSVHLQSHLTRNRRIEAPHFVAIEAPAGSTTLATGGLPYHMRVGARMLDTLLVVSGEKARTFRFGLGLDIAHPWMAALDLLSPQILSSSKAAAPAPVSYGWLFHVDAKNVLATHWSPLVETTESGDGKKVVGVRCRLLEMEGRTNSVQLRCFRTPTSAQTTDFENRATGSLSIRNDGVTLDIGAYEWVQVEARW